MSVMNVLPVGYESHLLSYKSLEQGSIQQTNMPTLITDNEPFTYAECITGKAVVITSMSELAANIASGPSSS